MKTIIILIIFIFKTLINAQPLEFYHNSALLNNPEIQAKFEEIKALKAGYKASGYWHDPSLSVSYMPMIGDISQYSVNASVGVNLPRSGQLQNQKDMAYYSYMSSMHSFREFALLVLQDITNIYYDIAKLKIKKEGLMQSLVVLKQLETATENEYSFEAASLYDLFGVQEKIDEKENEIAKVEKDIELAKKRLSALTYVDEVIVIVSENLPQYNHISPRDLLTENNPALTSFEYKKLEKQKALKGVDYSSSAGIHLGLGVSVKNSEMEANGASVMAGPMAQISLPVFRNKFVAQREQITSEISSIEQSYKRVYDNLVLQLDEIESTIAKLRLDSTYTESVLQRQVNLIEVIKLDYGNRDFLPAKKYFNAHLRKIELETELDLIKIELDKHKHAISRIAFGGIYEKYRDKIYNID